MPKRPIDRLMDKAAQSIAKSYQVLLNPLALDMFLYVLENPEKTKEDLLQDLSSKHNSKTVWATYDKLQTVAMLPFILERKGGKLELYSHSYNTLRGFGSMYKRMKRDFPDIKFTKEVDSKLDVIGKHLRWMPKEQEEDILKEKADKIRDHLTSLRSMLTQYVQDSYGSLPFGVAEYKDMKTMRHRFKFHEGEFLFGLGYLIRETGDFLERPNDDKTVVEHVGQALNYIPWHLSSVVEAAQYTLDRFQKRTSRILHGKPYVTNREYGRRVPKPNYSNSARTLAKTLSRNTKAIKGEFLGIANIQKEAYEILPLGTFH